MNKDGFIRACREGGPLIEQALLALHRDYGRALLREGWLALRDHDAAQDLLQDTLVKAWRRCSSFRGDAEVYPWLKQVLRRTAIDRLRASHPETALDDTQGQTLPEVESALRAARPGAADEPEAVVGQRQVEATYRRCAARFAVEQPQAAEVIRWLAEDDLTPAQIAELLQRSPGATREYISQCRKKARLYFADWYRLAAPQDAGALQS